MSSSSRLCRVGSGVKAPTRHIKKHKCLQSAMLGQLCLVLASPAVGRRRKATLGERAAVHSLSQYILQGIFFYTIFFCSVAISIRQFRMAFEPGQFQRHDRSNLVMSFVVLLRSFPFSRKMSVTAAVCQQIWNAILGRLGCTLFSCSMDHFLRGERLELRLISKLPCNLNNLAPAWLLQS